MSRLDAGSASHVVSTVAVSGRGGCSMSPNVMKRIASSLSPIQRSTYRLQEVLFLLTTEIGSKGSVEELSRGVLDTLFAASTEMHHNGRTITRAYLELEYLMQGISTEHGVSDLPLFKNSMIELPSTWPVMSSKR